MRNETAVERQFIEVILGELPGTFADATTVPPSSIGHSGLSRIHAEYLAEVSQELPSFDGIVSRLSDRPDLASAAKNLRLVGRQLNDRSVWCEKLVDKLKNPVEIPERLNVMDDAEALNLLRKLQAR